MNGTSLSMWRWLLPASVFLLFIICSYESPNLRKDLNQHSKSQRPNPNGQRGKFSEGFGILRVLGNFYGWNLLNINIQEDGATRTWTFDPEQKEEEGNAMRIPVVEKNERRIKRTKRSYDDDKVGSRRGSIGNTPVNNLEIQKVTVSPGTSVDNDPSLGYRRRSFGDIALNNLDIVRELKLDMKTFVKKHVRGENFAPTSTDSGAGLLSSLRQELKDEFYSRPVQSVILAEDTTKLEKLIRARAKDVWETSGAPKMVEIDNGPYRAATSDLKLANPDYDKAFAYLEKANSLRPGETLESFVKGGRDPAYAAEVQKRLDRTLGSVVFEIEVPILLKQSEFSSLVVVERIGDDPTVTKSNANVNAGPSGQSKPAEPFAGYGLSREDQDVKVVLYTKVDVPEGGIGEIKPERLKVKENTWQLHFDGDGPDSNPNPNLSGGSKKNYDHKINPVFTELDISRLQETPLIGQIDQNRKDIKNANPQSNQVVKKHVDTFSETYTKSQKEAGASKAELKKQGQYLPTLQLLDTKTITLELDTLKLEKQRLGQQQAILSKPDIKNIQTSNKVTISNAVKERHNIPITQDITVHDFTFEKERNLLDKKTIFATAQLEYVAAADGSSSTAKLDALLENMLNAKKDLDLTESLMKQDRKFGDILNLTDELKKRADVVIKASCGGSGGGRRRKRSCPCSSCQKKTVDPVTVNQKKLERKTKKFDKFKKLVKELFPPAQKNGESKGQKALPSAGKVKPDLDLEQIVKSKSLTKRITGSKFVQNFLGLPDVEQAYMGPKTVQNALASNKKPFSAKLGKVGGAIQKANYAFLVRDFTKAAIRGDPVQMSIMGGMFGLQKGASVLEKIATGQKVLGVTVKVGKGTAKAMMVTGRLVGGALSVVGAGFDIYSIVNSGKCLAQKSENKALCLRQDRNCKTENEICEGRDNVLDIVTNSLSIIGAAVTIAAQAVPIVGTIIGIVSFLITVFSEIYQAKTFLNNFEKDIPLYENERWKELGKRLIGQNVSDYLLELKEQKKVNTRLLENIREFLLQNSDLFWAYFAPARDSKDVPLLDNIIRVREDDYEHRKYSRWSPDPNRLVDGSKIYKIEDYEYFCRPNEYSSLTGYDFLEGYTYYCKNAVGVRVQNKKSVKELYAYFNLEKGLDVIIGFESVANYFDVHSGTKEFTGGEENDIFVVNDKFGGFLEGGPGANSLRLSDNLKSSSVEITNKQEDVGGQIIQIDGVTAALTGMHHIQGRSTGRETIHAACSTKTIDGAGGQDQVLIDPGLKCPRGLPISLRIDVRPGLTVKNDYEGPQGTFLYHLISDPILSGISRESQIYIRASAPSNSSSSSSSGSSAPEHQFFTTADDESLKISWSWVSPKGHFLQVHENVRNTLNTIFFQPSSNSQFGSYQYQALVQTKDGTTVSLVKDASGSSTQLDVPSSEIDAVVFSSVANKTCVLNIRRRGREPNKIKKSFEFEIQFVDSTSFRNSMNMAVTQDGAVLLLSKKEERWTALFYYSLEHLKIKDGARVLNGSLWNQNFFQIQTQISNPTSSTTKIQKILGGTKGDHFLLEQFPVHLAFLSSGSSGSDVLELGEDLRFQFNKVKTDFKNKFMEFQETGSGSFIKRKLELDGSFEIFLGQRNASDEFVVGCSTKTVDLRGGPGDEIIIPSFPKPCHDDNNANGIEIQIQAWPGTTIKNYYEHSGKITYIVQTPVFHPEDSTHTIEIKIESRSLENYVFLTQIDAEDLKNITVKNENGGKSLTLFVETFLQITFPAGKVPQIITKDGAILTLVPFGPETGGNSMYKPTFYFELTTGSHGNKRAVQGNLNYSNYFKLVDGHFSKIMGGKSDDHFLLGVNFQCDEIGGGDGGVDIIEILDSNNKGPRSQMPADQDFDLNLLKQVITFPNSNSQCKIIGDSFFHIFGQKGQNEKVTLTPGVLSVDLRGGISPSSPDSILIPRNEDSSEYNLTIALQNNTHLFSEGQHGSTTYHFRSGAGHSEVTLGNLSSTHKNIFSLDFPAQQLEILALGNVFTIQDLAEKENQLKLDVHPSESEFSNSLQILTREQARVIFLNTGQMNNFEAGFKFILTEASDTEGSRANMIYGGKSNPNFFIINGIYKAVHGGRHSDKFIIGPDSRVELIDCGDNPHPHDSLIFDDSTSGQLKIDLVGGAFYRTVNGDGDETEPQKTEIKGKFGYIEGRSSGSEVLILHPSAKSITLQGTEGPPEKRDCILVPENPDQSIEYNVVIDYYDSSQFLLFNGAKSGKFIYNVQSPAGEFQLFNIYDPYETAPDPEEILSADLESKTGESPQESFHLSSTLFFDLFSVEADPDTQTVKIQIREGENSEVQDVSFTTRHFATYGQLFETFEQHVKARGNLRRNPEVEEEETTTNWNPPVSNDSLDYYTESAPVSNFDVGPDPQLPINPLIRFPTFTTSDDYEFVINHVGGIHAVTSISLSSFSYASGNSDVDEIAEEVINQHIQIVNDLGISLIISLVDQNPESPEKMTVKEMIFMGGDDEIDSLMNHASISSHLVGNAGGDTNLFVILPTLNQVPVYIYLPQAQIKKSISCHNKLSLDQDSDSDFESIPLCDENLPNPVPDPVNLLNLAAFFDRPTNPYEFPDEDQTDETENPNTVETTTTTTNEDSFTANSSHVDEGDDDDQENDSGNETKTFKFKTRKPKIFIPEIIQEDDSDLRILVKYLNDPFGHESEELTQEIVFVGGVEDHRKLSIRLYVASYRIEKGENTEEWSMVPEKLVVPGPSSQTWSFPQNSLKGLKDASESKKSRTKRQALGEEDNNNNHDDNNDNDDEDGLSTESDGVQYLFLSHADLVEHLDFGIPIQLDKTTKTLDGPKSFYRNGESLIITNKVDLDPSLDFNDIWRSSGNDADSDVHVDSASAITIVLLDIQEPMEQENFTITIKTLDLDDSKTLEDSVQDFTISFDSFHQLQDYKEAVQEAEENKEWNQKVGFGILLIFILTAVFLALLFLFFIVCKFLASQEQQLHCLNCLGLGIGVVKKRGIYTVNKNQDDNKSNFFSCLSSAGNWLKSTEAVQVTSVCPLEKRQGPEEEEKQETKYLFGLDT